MQRFAIHYDDGAVVTGLEGDWATAPDEGVLIVEEWGDGRCDVHYGRDYYLLREGTVMAFDAVALHGHMRLGLEKGAIKYGRWTTDDNWRRVWNRAFPEEPR